MGERVGIEETRLVYETYWYAECGCGWRTEAPNDADTCVNKVKTHVLALHRDSGADIVISGRFTARRMGELPATNAPDADAQLAETRAVFGAQMDADATAGAAATEQP